MTATTRESQLILDARDAALRSSNPAPLSLDWLLTPTTTASFLKAYWCTEPLFVTRDESDYFAALPGLDDIDALITTTTRSRKDGRMVRATTRGLLDERDIGIGANGIPDIQHVYQSFDQGYTVILNQLHRRCTSVAQLCRNIEETLHHNVGANAYVTPRRSQGFLPHVDGHDVFIVQLYGQKNWRVGEPDDEVSPEAWKQLPCPHFQNPRQFDLSPGDVLYIPKGFPHEAVSAATSAFHLTVGIHHFTWLDICVGMLNDLAERDKTLRQPLPAGFLNGTLDATPPSSLLQELATTLTETDLIKRAQTRLGTELLQLGKARGGHFKFLELVRDISQRSVVVRAPGRLCRVRSDSKEASIEFDTNYVAGPSRLEPAMDFIAANVRFAVHELPGDLTSGDKVDLVRRLIVEGLLTVDETTREGAEA